VTFTGSTEGAEIAEWIGDGWTAGCAGLRLWRDERTEADRAICHITTGTRTTFFGREDQALRPLVWEHQPVVVVGSPSGAIRMVRLAWCLEDVCDAPILK
jgi:hypothetical protein